jgi:two-component system cell cycle sensor histidine kinase/response regulator CckA
MRHSLQWRLPLLVSGLLVALLATFLLTSYVQVRGALLRAGRERAVGAAEQLAALLSPGLRQRTADLRREAADPLVRQYLQDRAEASRPEVEARLRSVTAAGQQVVELWTAHGERLAAVASPAAAASSLPPGAPPAGEGVWFSETPTHGVISESIEPISQDGGASSQLAGYLLVRRAVSASSNPDALSRLVGGGARVQLGGRQGQSWTDLVHVVPAPPVDLRQLGASEYQRADGEWRVGALAEVSGTPWLVLVDFPRAAVLQPARLYLNRMVLIGLGLVLLAGIVGRMAMARITKPLAALTGASEAIAAGDYARRVAEGRPDELGRLGVAFNSMVRQIQDGHDQLQARVRERTEALEALQNSEARHRAIVSVAFDSIITIDPSGLVTEFNPAAERTFGYTRSEVMGRELAELIVPPRYREAHRRGLAHYAATGEGPAIGRLVELTAQRSDKTEFPVELAIKAVQVNGQAMFTAYVRDLSERKRLEEAQRRLAAIVEAGTDFVTIGQPHGPPLYINRAAREAFGIGPTEQVESLTAFRPPGFAQFLESVILPSTRREGVWKGETEYVARSGRVIPVSQVSVAQRDAAGGVEFLSTVSRDISQERRNAEALRASEERTQFALEAARASIWQADIATGSVSVTDSIHTVHGVSREQFGGTLESFIGRIHPEDRASTSHAIQTAQARRGDFELEFRTLWPDGSTHWVQSRGRVLCDADGRPVHVLGMAQNVTERKQLEGQLRHAQKLEAVGQLAGGLAHDFNNLLTVIVGYSRLLEEQFEAHDPRRADVAEIRRAGERAGQLTKQLLAFSRKQILQPVPLDLNALVTGASRMLQPLIGEHVQLRLSLQADLAPIVADPGQIEQVLINLAINARDAMDHGGILTIETANVTLDEAAAGRHLADGPGTFVLLAVGDTGTGMDEETKKRIFEPFFTTKAPGKGTGMGLASAFGIVQQSGGFISVYSELGYGSTFKMYFPPGDVRPEAARVESASTMLPGSETILLAEDDPGVRALVGAVLKRSGYAVLVAALPSEALSIAGERDRRIDLLLTDVIMPGMSGSELCRRVQAMRPGLRVLYMSGFADDTVVHHGVLDPDTPFLQKPFTGPALAQKIRETLDRPVGTTCEALGSRTP